MVLTLPIVVTLGLTKSLLPRATAPHLRRAPPPTLELEALPPAAIISAVERAKDDVGGRPV